MIAAEYKKLENRFARAVNLRMRRIRRSTKDAFVHALKKGGRRFTVMVVPHSEKRVFNFQLSFFSIIFFTFLISLVLAGFALLAAHARSANARLKQVSQDYLASESALENLRDAAAQLRGAERGVRASVQNVRLALANQGPVVSTDGGVASLFSVTDAGQTSLSALAGIKNATSLLENSAEMVGDVGKILRTYKEFLADTPTMWPLKGVHGVITTRFGWTINPFSRLGYLHQGIDVAWGVGTPIIAAANGVVAQTGCNDVLGNFVVVRHKYGFMTGYLHMLRITTHSGAHVNRGDVIGYVGATGLATGPHLHYEVHLGDNYLDPMNFLSLPSDLNATRTTGVASD